MGYRQNQNFPNSFILNNNLPKQQGGWTFMGLLVVLVVVGFFIYLAFKLVPPYTDHETLKALIRDTVNDRALLSKHKREIEKSIFRRMRVNNTEIPDGAVEVVKDKGTVTLALKYEIRVPIYANVDAIVYFNETYEGQELE